MCGLIYVHRNDGLPANKMLAKRYTEQKGRGTEGFGYVELNTSGKIQEIWRSKDESSIMSEAMKSEAPIFFFHHRFPTSTPNVIEATHPIVVKHKSLEFDYYVIHNGVITNDDALKVEHEALGFVYTTEMTEELKTHGKKYITRTYYNDSEALAIEFALTLEKGQKELNASGMTAFLALQVKKNTSQTVALYYGRNYGNPLKLERQATFFSLTSSGEGENVAADKLFRYDYATGETTSHEFEIGEFNSNYNTYYGADNYDAEVAQYYATTGVQVPRQLNLVPHDSNRLNSEDALDEFTEDEYYEALLTEKDDLQEMLEDAKNNDDMESIAGIQADLVALTRQIAKYEHDIIARE